jgi:two-component system NtrC family sensor kinase
VIERREISGSGGDAAGSQLVAARFFRQLGQRLSTATTQETVIEAVIETLRERYPDRCCAVRVIDAESGQLTAAVAHGSLLPVARENILISRESLARAGIVEGALPQNVRACDAVAPIFAGCRQSMSVPLVAGRQLLGLVNLEWPHASPLEVADEELLDAVASQAASALRSVQLIFDLSGMKIYLEEVIERANALVLVLDARLRIQVFNHALSTLTGYSREEMLGRPFGDLVFEGDRLKVARAIAQSLRGMNVNNLRLALKTKQGATRPVAANAASLLSPEGHVRGVIAIGQDLTRAEQLESQVQQAQKLASFGRLAAGIVHELNNPLTSITLNTELLRQELVLDHSAASSQREKVASIEAAAQRILSFTRELLDYARPALDETRPVEVRDLLQTAVEFCEHHVRQSGAMVHLSVPQGLPPVLGVRSHLQQVVVNLLSNACDAMSEPGTIEVSAEVGGGEVAIHVRDEGAGIRPELLEKIFDPFVSTKPSGRGTGLGLSIVQGIVHKHGGQISVRSQLGKGTTFTVVLPAAQAGLLERFG